MTPHRKLLAACIKSREAYDMVGLSGESAGFTGALEPLWGATVRYYESDSQAKRADVDILASYATTGELHGKHAKQRLDLLAELDALDVSVANVAAALREASLERAGHELAQAVVAGRDETEIREKLDAYQQLFESVPGGGEDPDQDWYGLIAKRADPEARWACGIDGLDETLGGGVLPGHNITIFARPEAGKTALAISMACGFARSGKKVLYIGNEDPIEDLRLRAVTNLVGKPAHILLTNPEKAERLAVERGADKLIMRELCPGTGAEMERLVRAHKPGVLIVDQLRNIRVKGDNFTQQLDKAAQLVRALGKKYKMVTVSVTQAGDSARDKVILDDGDIDSSNTGIPGAADVLIGMGVDDNLRMAGQRCLSFCKNKVSARHDQVNVFLDEAISKIRS
jgi:hypothetical protein